MKLARLITYKLYLTLLMSLLLASCHQSSSDQPETPTGPVNPPNQLAGPRPDFGPRDYVLFESGQVRPLAISADGQRLFATNTPDNRLEIFSIGAQRLTPLHSVPVGLEPVALAIAPDGQVWVVNHLSDSVSIVDVNAEIPQVINTLLVGDEPQDIVFAGEENKRAFISTAHRGQNSPVNPQLTTPSVGRADIWVFDSTQLGSALGGEAETIVTLFGDKPRGLAVSADGNRVYASIFKSGNRTASIAPDNLSKPLPHSDADGIQQPDSGLILQFNGTHWVDERGANYSNRVPFSLPDYDLFEISANAAQPYETKRWRGVGTSLFNLAVHPTNRKIYVSNLDANNQVRFSGQGSNSTTVNGRLADNRITIIDGDSVSPRRLNKHLSFDVPQGSQADRDTSLSMPLAMTFNNDGSELFVTAYGSQKVAIYATEALDNDSFVPTSANHIALSGGGPSGIVLDASGQRGYVMTRFDNGISVINTDTKTEIDHLQMFNPEPASVIEGRPFLFDARLTSGKGNDSCASCHLFGDTDGLAWDLGDPGGQVKANPNAFINISGPAMPNQFHAMKGPMLTQSMRGIKGHGPMHWRGDKTGANRVGDETLEEAAFKEFNEAYTGVLGRDEQISAQQMQAFTDYAMELTYPPNPIRALNNQLNSQQAAGLDIFNRGVVRIQTGALEVCAQCHTIDKTKGIFGTSGLMSDNGQAGEKNMKIPHFRDQYQKVGNFGWGFNREPATGPQVKGFGFNHNGSTSGNFVIADLGMADNELAQIRAFLFAFPSEQAPIVGQQITLTASNASRVNSRIDLLVERGLITTPVAECDLVVKGVIDGKPRGFMMNAQGQFISDKSNESPLTLREIKNFAQLQGDSLTFTCTPWGSGKRIGIDRDRDNILDGDEA